MKQINIAEVNIYGSKLKEIVEHSTMDQYELFNCGIIGLKSVYFNNFNIVVDIESLDSDVKAVSGKEVVNVEVKGLKALITNKYLDLLGQPMDPVDAAIIELENYGVVNYHSEDDDPYSVDVENRISLGISTVLTDTGDKFIEIMIENQLYSRGYEKDIPLTVEQEIALENIFFTKVNTHLVKEGKSPLLKL